MGQFKQSGPATFGLALSGEYNFECEEIVRCVPGKRLVCRGRLDDQSGNSQSGNQQSVYAKLFIGRHAKRYAARDLRGIQALADAGIPTPSILFVGAIADDADDLGEALIFATVPASINAEQALKGFGQQADRLILAKKLVAEVARHHQAGLIQTDLYLKNFLLQGKQVYTLDGDAIRKLSAIFGQHQALKNLALLLSKFDVSDTTAWLPELLDDYAKVRGWNTAPGIAAMSKRVSAHRRRVVSHYANEKVFRQCSDIQVEKNFDYFLAVARQYFSEDLRRALNDPDKLLNEPAEPLKSGNTCTVSLAEVDGRKVVVKRYNIKSFWHGLSRALRPTRAAVSWANAHRLLMYGIATAAPIVLLEKRCGIIRRQAYFLAEYIDAPDAAEFFADANVDAVQKNKIAEHVAQLFHKLYLLKIAHGDFKAGNMKIVAGKPFLLDLDSMREYCCGWQFARRHVRDLRRFMRNWQHDIDASNRLAAAFRATYKDTRLLDEAGMAITQSGAT